MRIAITGGTGLVGRFIVADALAAGDGVLALSRPDYRLGDRPDLSGCDALVHCAFHHAPGRYRGGEADDPAGFISANLDGTVALFEAAKAAGVARAIFLSTRAVYDGYPPGTCLTEDLPPLPTTLYGQVKWDAEQALQALNGPGFSTAAIRATGIYGPGPGHKWTGLFADFLAGRPISSRRSTELHGADLATAVRLLLGCTAQGTFNASDILLDRHDLLMRVKSLTASPHIPPPSSDTPISVMCCDNLQALGWQPAGWAGLERTLPQLVKDAG
ncbi:MULTISPECIES: NAD(P)-dependent oxidoreductase [unclassified Yoonia]|uniref:NAD-dependent epimerase/dehydratase family protein n=1 Tax=unclassified Yoonia TaxID=2629118 RepID=UPI002AFFD25A|nr:MULTISPECIES: NAD(P)-dependent oxidoreductase [unclassified Yoonia]